MAILNRIKFILLEKNISQNELCEAINISKSTLSNIISNKQNATLETAFDIAEYFHLPVDKIFYKNKLDEKSSGQFVEMIECMNELYSIYEQKDMNRDVLKKVFKSLIDEYIHKYGKNTIHKLLENYLSYDSDIKEINTMAFNMINDVKVL